MVKAVNGSIPGPPIVVYEGQTVTVHIRNMLLSDSATIHFHGLHQQDTPYFDGMPYITQCPIAAGQTFTHEFKVIFFSHRLNIPLFIVSLDISIFLKFSTLHHMQQLQLR